MKAGMLAQVAALAALLAPAGRAEAHATSTGLARVAVEGDSVAYRVTLLLAELPEAQRRLLAAAAEGDPASVDRVGVELRRLVQVRAEDGPCRPIRALVQGSRLGDTRVDLELRLRCPSAPARLWIRDGWWLLLGEHHRTLARIDGPAGTREIAFGPEAPEAAIDLGPGAPRGGTGFFRLGVEHILTGWDHLLFLAALLLGGGRLLSLVETVTAFTLAHSITLALAVLGLAVIPGRIVEPAIAASIVFVALGNVRASRAPGPRWLVSFAFGLVHGFGFASALRPLALPRGSLARALLEFNLGVEAGQGLVIALAFPLLAWMRGAAWEPRAVRLTSLALALTGTLWLVQRLLPA